MPNPTARVVDENGYMMVRGCRISREGVYDYAAKQVYPQGHPNMGDPDRIIGVYRPESEIRDPDSIDSFKHIPFIDEHAMLAGDTSAAKYPDDISPEEYGVNGVLSDVYFDESDGWLKGDVKVWGREAQKTVRSGKDDLSAGFNCKFKIGSGTFKGKPYEVTQIHMRGNHLANVDEARVEGARILDARCFDSANLALTIETKEVSEMPKPIKGRAADSALDQLKALVPALQSIIAQGEKGDLDDDEKHAAQDSDVENAEHVENEDADATRHDDADADKDADGVDDDSDSDDRDVDASNAVVEQAKGLLAQIQELLSNQEVQTQDDSDVDASVEDACDSDDKEEKQAMDENEIIAKAEDSALRRFRADEAKKGKMYDRLSNVIGAFDHRAMDSKSMAQYGLKKLGVSAAKGTEDVVLDSYLNGLAAAQKKNSAEITSRAADSKAKSAQLDQYLEQGAK